MALLCTCKWTASRYKSPASLIGDVLKLNAVSFQWVTSASPLSWVGWDASCSVFEISLSSSMVCCHFFCVGWQTSLPTPSVALMSRENVFCCPKQCYLARQLDLQDHALICYIASPEYIAETLRNISRIAKSLLDTFLLSHSIHCISPYPRLVGLLGD